MNGIGNDFVVIDTINQHINITKNIVKRIADRHRGVGCDQLLIIEPPKESHVDFNYRIFNRDGLEASQCGNGARCIAKFIYDQGLSGKRRLLVSSIGGMLHIELVGKNMVAVEIQPPSFDPKKVPFKNEKQEKSYKLEDPVVLQSGIVIASPHSGRNYRSSVKEQSILDPTTLRSSEDAFVDELMDFAPDLGIPLICSKIPRAFVDLNRARDELDSAIIAGIRPNGQNPRVISGLGVIPRVVANGKEIYSGKLSKEAAFERLEKFWDPYHSKLSELLDRAYRQFGYSILIDAHSMPHEAILKASTAFTTSPLVLGDR